MAKFHGKIGYNLGTVEYPPGSDIYVNDIVEKSYYGDIIQNTRQMREGDSILNDISVQNSISVVADAYANNHFFAIRYVEWAGSLWDVTDVTVERPRLLLRLGGVYNGPTPGAEPNP